jgi:hypothetical protein
MDLSIIKSKIRIIRGRKVLLDFDLAEMYETETAHLKRQVRRNIKPFEGEDFMFEVTKEELSRCQIGVLKKGRGSNFKYAPFAFTELGVAMLSSVLESDKAIEVNRDIMRVFVLIRHYNEGLTELNQKLEMFMMETNMQFNEIYQALIELAEQKAIYKPINPVAGFITPKKEQD